MNIMVSCLGSATRFVVHFDSFFGSRVATFNIIRYGVHILNQISISGHGTLWEHSVGLFGQLCMYYLCARG